MFTTMNIHQSATNSVGCFRAAVAGRPKVALTAAAPAAPISTRTAPTKPSSLKSQQQPRPEQPPSATTSFRQDASVAKWKSKTANMHNAALHTEATWRAMPRTPNAKPQQPAYDVWQDLQLVAEACKADPQAALYWAYHTARLLYFAAQASTALTLAAVLPSGGGAGKLQHLLASLDSETQATVQESVHVWLQDWAWIQKGTYQLPWDMVTPNIRQNNPLVMGERFLRTVGETILMVGRSDQHDSLQAHPTWLQGPMYPQYFTKTFHYQTDGWFSSQSAERHADFQETGLLGMNDAMQRTALVPISEYIAASGKAAAQLKLLEVGAGTGRFHTFVKDNWPMMRTIVSDLSPFYLQQARENINEWKQARQPHRQLGGPDGAGVEYLQTAAEDLHMPDASIDMVVNMYLLHELPPSIRRRAVAEMYRVLKPGGLCVMNDSVQFGDRPAWDNTLHIFGHQNEPHWMGYARQDMAELFASAGFELGTEYLSGCTKTLSFTKPATA